MSFSSATIDVGMNGYRHGHPRPLRHHQHHHPQQTSTSNVKNVFDAHDENDKKGKSVGDYSAFGFGAGCGAVDDPALLVVFLFYGRNRTIKQGTSAYRSITDVPVACETLHYDPSWMWKPAAMNEENCRRSKSSYTSAHCGMLTGVRPDNSAGAPTRRLRS